MCSKLHRWKGNSIPEIISLCLLPELTFAQKQIRSQPQQCLSQNYAKLITFQQVSKHELRYQNICPNIVSFFALKWMQLTKKNLDSRLQFNSGTEVLNDNVLSYTCFKPESRQSLSDCPADYIVNCHLTYSFTNSPTPCLFFQRLTKSWNTK